MTKRIPLSGKRGKGKFALVDDADYADLSRFKWYIANTGYVYSYPASWRDGVSPVAMHRYIMNPPSRKVVDHVNSDKLNNTRQDLRIATPSENTANSRPSTKSSSKYKGVHWNTNKARWVASITVNYKQIIVGQFVTQREAALAYNDAALHHFGEFARLNTIPLVDPLDKPVAKRRLPPSSKFRGVSKTESGKWATHIRMNGRQTHLGTFADELDAAKAYDDAARIHHGEKAKLNFP